MESKNIYGLSPKQIVEKWSNPELGDLCVESIEDSNSKFNTAVLLETQYREFNKSSGSKVLDEAVNDTTGIGGASAQFAPITIALARRSYPELFANKIVGMQPMQGPVGLAYALRFVYGGTNPDNNEMGFQVVPEYSGFTGSTSGTSGTADAGTGISTAAAEGVQATTNQGRLKIEQTSVTALERKIASEYSLESAQDLKAMHALDIEREMISTMDYELKAEIDREILARCKASAVDVATGGEAATAFDVSGSDGRWQKERLSALATKILEKANDIHTSTRQQAGNFVVVSPKVATALQSVGNAAFFQPISNTVKGNTNVVQVGSIAGTIAVYRDANNTANDVLVGFKGSNTNQTGVIFSPYKMAVRARAVNQNDFSPILGVFSRYAITNSLMGTGRYYRRINLTNLDAVLGS